MAPGRRQFSPGWRDDHAAEPAQDLQTLDFLEEELVPRTTAVSAGEVIVHKQVVTEMRTLLVPVRREVVQVYRQRPSGRPVGSPGAPMEVSPPAVETTGTDIVWDAREEEEVSRPSELVRPRKSVETEPVSTNVQLQHEDVRIEREPVSGREVTGEHAFGEHEHEVVLNS